MVPLQSKLLFLLAEALPVKGEEQKVPISEILINTSLTQIVRSVVTSALYSHLFANSIIPLDITYKARLQQEKCLLELKKA